MSRKLLFLSVCLVMLLMTAAATAQWTEEGALVHDIVTYLYNSQGVVPDGTGGMYAFFADNFSGKHHVRGYLRGPSGRPRRARLAGARHPPGGERLRLDS